MPEEPKLEFDSKLAGQVDKSSSAPGSTSNFPLPASSFLYPIMLTPAFFVGRPALVVGGGRVAERKIRRLLEADVRVRLISPALTPNLGQLAENGSVEWFRREWQEGDIWDYPQAMLVFATTGDPAVNR